MNKSSVLDITPQDETLHGMIKRITAACRKAGYTTKVKIVKEAVAQAYGYHNYSGMVYHTNGGKPNTSYIEPTFWRVLGYPNGSFTQEEKK